MENTAESSIADQRYVQLGNLFYSVAAADNRVHPKEVSTLKKIIKEKWLQVDDLKDEYGSDAAYQIEIVFDWLHEHMPEVREIYNEFEEFYNAHPGLFPPAVKKLVWQTADAIAAAYAGKNKSEVILLSRLKQLLSN